MNNQERGRRGADEAKSRAGWNIDYALGLTHPMMVPTSLKSPKARKLRSIMDMSDAELDKIMGWEEEG